MHGLCDGGVFSKLCAFEANKHYTNWTMVIVALESLLFVDTEAYEVLTELKLAVCLESTGITGVCHYASLHNQIF